MHVSQFRLLGGACWHVFIQINEAGKISASQILTGTASPLGPSGLYFPGHGVEVRILKLNAFLYLVVLPSRLRLVGASFVNIPCGFPRVNGSSWDERLWTEQAQTRAHDINTGLISPLLILLSSHRQPHQDNVTDPGPRNGILGGSGQEFKDLIK